MFEKIRLLAEYAPLLGYAQDIGATKDPHERALIAIEAASWLARRSETTVDDEVLSMIKEVLESEAGERLFTYIVDSIKKAVAK